MIERRETVVRKHEHDRDEGRSGSNHPYCCPVCDSASFVTRIDLYVYYQIAGFSTSRKASMIRIHTRGRSEHVVMGNGNVSAYASPR